MGLVKREDLYFGKKGLSAKILSGVAMKVAAADRLNEFYDGVSDSSDNAPSNILSSLQVSCNVRPGDIKNIPSSGAAIVVANHHTGALDGVLLMKILSEVRPDVKFMGNFLLSKIKLLENYFISVDPFDNNGSKNISGIRQSLEHIKNGGLLVIFPAGEVATWQKGFCDLKDKPWSTSVMRFIRTASVPVIPIFINAKNSTIFHLLGKVHPRLRTAMLPREFLNKRGQNIDIYIGSPLTPKRAEELENLDQYTNFLRANVYYMTPFAIRKRRVRKQEKKTSKIKANNIAEAISTEILISELDSIREDHLLVQYGDMEVFFSPPANIPNIMQEIGRLRELTFRSVGEGTNKEIDTDYFDNHYHQLFIWDRANAKIVGAYRFGMGDDIVKNYGLKGFYTNTLFRMSPEMTDIMSKTIELGRSFIVPEYQRQAAPLMLLWKGILLVLLKNEQFRYLMGPVTISGDFNENSKQIIITNIKECYTDKDKSRYIHPVTGFKSQSKIDASLIKDIRSIDLINKLVCDIEHNGLTVPVLIKRYLQLNSHILGFNTDHDFCDAVDALILLDLKQTPEDTILLLSKELKDIDIIGRFKHIVD